MGDQISYIDWSIIDGVKNSEDGMIAYDLIQRKFALSEDKTDELFLQLINLSDYRNESILDTAKLITSQFK